MVIRVSINSAGFGLASHRLAFNTTYLLHCPKYGREVFFS
jgi:hypothetical protein